MSLPKPQINFRALTTQCENAVYKKDYVLAFRLATGLLAHAANPGRAKKIHKSLAQNRAIVAQINAGIARSEPDQDTQKQLLHIAQAQNYADLLAHCQHHLSHKPQSVFLKQLAATAAAKLGYTKDAERYYAHALARDPLNAGLRKNYAIFLKSVCQYNKAREQFYFSCQLLPRDTECFSALAELELDLKQYQMAEQLWQHAIALSPQDDRLIMSYYACLIDRGKFNSAQKLLSRLKQISDKDWQVLLCQAYAARHAGVWQEALMHIDAAEKLAGPHHEIIIEKANILKDQKRYDEASSLLTSALLHESEHSYTMRWNLSFCALMTGDFATGWQYYETRWHSRNWNSPALDTIKPRWTGTETGRILLWNEQGVGDEIMFLSLLVHLPTSEQNIAVRCDRRIIPMLSRAYLNQFKFLAADEAVEPSEYDYHLPVGSLPSVLGFDPQNKTYQQQPYMKADKDKVAQLSATFAQTKDLIVGVSWKSTGSLYGSDKNIELSEILDSLSGEDVQFINLQYGDVSDDLRKLNTDMRDRFNTMDEIDKRDDLDRLAALMACCDVIVTTANATVHLASALGRPTHLILTERHSWEWHQSWERSYWYPECRIHRVTDQMSLEQILKQIKTEMTVTSASQT